jgi:hypothetical protein
MAEIGTANAWGRQEEIDEQLSRLQRRKGSPTKYPSRSSREAFSPAPEAEEASTNIWLNPELEQHDATANLDDQLPVTLYYLGRLVNDVPQVSEVYVEELEGGRRKHWAVLSERDYDVMDEIYDIEEGTLSRFPNADINFRVTVSSDSGPSITSQATRILSI